MHEGIRPNRKRTTSNHTIVQRYGQDFEGKDRAESFTVYKLDSSRPTEIFAGATKLSMTDQIEDLLNDLFHWLKCLTEVRRKVDGGEWRQFY